MKIILIIKKLAFALLTILVLHFSLRYLGLVMTPGVEREDGTTIRSGTKDHAALCFSLEKPNSVDTVFIGSSHVYCGIDVNILNHEYGMNSIMLATTSQTMDLSYYAAMAAIEMQHPKTIVLEVFGMRADAEQSELASRSLLNDLPNWSRAKYLAARNAVNPAYYYYYPIAEVHSNWWKISSSDLIPQIPKRGERYSLYSDTVVPVEEWETIDKSVTAALPSISKMWLEEIVDICEKNGVELVLYTIPFPSTAKQQAIFNGLADFAEERGIEYYNLLGEYEKVGINAHTDFMDDHHLNRSGQEKVTRYLAEHCLGK